MTARLTGRTGTHGNLEEGQSRCGTSHNMRIGVDPSHALRTHQRAPGDLLQTSTLATDSLGYTVIWTLASSSFSLAYSVHFSNENTKKYFALFKIAYRNQEPFTVFFFFSFRMMHYLGKIKIVYSWTHTGVSKRKWSGTQMPKSILQTKGLTSPFSTLLPVLYTCISPPFYQRSVVSGFQRKNIFNVISFSN